ncbi:MlaD family protein [Roseivirga thermotolerans]|uniref:Mammalian cell entry protein n=1 Tax=Roseivirga thermotolerans TaxID=1758176 RepID=A0ABQ3I6G8_9BACT|nr:MlaD family protein [Roseivirga thermotolerans]GHE66322.1 mammalian cell entry protein [Roseivirga thermotolerans]
MAKGKEFKVGLFVVLMAASLYIGFNYLRGLDVFSPLTTYYVKYPNVSGLNKGDRVILNGLDVGSVIERRFSNEQYNEILVTLAIDKTIKLTDSTLARLAKPDFLGGIEVQLVLNSGGTRILEKGDTLIGEIDGGITELLTQEGLSAANQLTALVNRINNVLEPFAEKTDAIAAAIDNFKKLSDGLVVTNELAQTSMKQFNLRLEYVTDSLVAAMGGVKPLMDEYKKLGEKLNAVDVESRLERIDSVLYSTQSFLARLNSDDGTLGKLLTNDSLYNTLNRTMADLDSLMIDLRYNPKRYMHFSIFGRKNRPPADSRKSNR